MKNLALLTGKKGIILGVANTMSIAWKIAQLCHAHEAEIAITYQDDRLKTRINPLAEATNCSIFKCDVKEITSIDELFDKLATKWGNLDFLVHSIAYTDKEAFRKQYIDTSRENFLNTLDISCYSFTYLSKKAAALMKHGGSILTLSYYGSQKVIPSYNVMGVAKAALEASVRYIAADLGSKNIRVNAISAGPIRTLSASVIGDFRTILNTYQSSAPLRRNITQSDVANTVLYLISDLSNSVTGQIHYVDCGYSIMGIGVINSTVSDIYNKN
ncbi:enoyl-[acyl-carrier-protein] reductase [Orientia chuto str. Dubai]|uniref:Enoyl-[acyl-carrier-protein] reductase [NADH] n=1 Tax=Orientia chuto str. Dubai TaxID=1359168 RepID=A0A0F3MJ88_9RICK|nr:enoyl-ACP reductase [Candidatus Orientia mediorientalis]KJV55711.1 enoyl-[acyl-carrier-protein] reductase [Orientia chuto str. Dubai]